MIFICWEIAQVLSWDWWRWQKLNWKIIDSTGRKFGKDCYRNNLNCQASRVTTSWLIFWELSGIFILLTMPSKLSNTSWKGILSIPITWAITSPSSSTSIKKHQKKYSIDILTNCFSSTISTNLKLAIFWWCISMQQGTNRRKYCQVFMRNWAELFCILFLLPALRKRILSRVNLVRKLLILLLGSLGSAIIPLWSCCRKYFRCWSCLFDLFRIQKSLWSFCVFSLWDFQKGWRLSKDIVKE